MRHGSELHQRNVRLELELELSLSSTNYAYPVAIEFIVILLHIYPIWEVGKQFPFSKQLVVEKSILYKSFHVYWPALANFSWH